jgi:Na+/H+-dicarboxylate symporter
MAWFALLVAMVLTVFWAWLLRASLLAFRVTSDQMLKLLWLPLAPVVYAGLVVAVVRMLQSTEAELASLRSQSYVFHKA